MCVDMDIDMHIDFRIGMCVDMCVDIVLTFIDVLFEPVLLELKLVVQRNLRLQRLDRRVAKLRHK